MSCQQALYIHGADDCDHVQTPFWVLAAGGLGIVLGLTCLGHKVMETIGSGLTNINFSRGFSIELGSTVAVVVASVVGMPVSSTHCQVHIFNPLPLPFPSPCLSPMAFRPLTVVCLPLPGWFHSSCWPHGIGLIGCQLEALFQDCGELARHCPCCCPHGSCPPRSHIWRHQAVNALRRLVCR